MEQKKQAAADEAARQRLYDAEMERRRQLQLQQQEARLLTSSARSSGCPSKMLFV